jgi:hypothetical protein
MIAKCLEGQFEANFPGFIAKLKSQTLSQYFTTTAASGGKSYAGKLQFYFSSVEG